MINANDLIQKQQERENNKINSFKKVFSNIQKKILLASSYNYYYLWYEVPEFIFGLPKYKMNECIDYLSKQLKDCNFQVNVYKPNILFIQWFPKN